jgi:hypothetical protein
MSIHQHHPDPTPPGVLAEAVAMLRGVAEVLWSAQSDEALVGVVERVQVLSSVLAAVEAGAVAEADARDLAKERLHYGSTGDWLTHTGGLRRGEGKKRVVRAKGLTGPLTRTRQALVAGTVSPGQVDLIVDAVQALPSGELVRARGERAMVDHAQCLDATELARLGRHLAHVVDPDAEDRLLEAQLAREDRAAHLNRYLAITEDRAGGVRIKGYGSTEDGAVLKAVLLPLTCPTPAVDEEDGSGDQTADPRDHGARLWDALITTAHHAITTHLPPETHGTPTRLVITVDHDTLKNQLTGHGIDVTEDDLELPAATVRRLACDAEIIPAVLGGHGEVLDVGRTRRLVTAALWTALVLRDRHCTFPGCTRPPIMCHAHHLTHWINGGETNLDNLALLCGHHHRVIHHTPWQIRLNPDHRKPEFKPPPKPGIEQQWIRQRNRLE